MNKLLAVATAVALSCAFAACKKKEDKAADPPKAETTEPSGSAPATPPAGPPAAGVPADRFPAECARFKALSERLGTCEKLAPDVRQGVRSSWVMMTKSLTMGAYDEATAKANCTKAADALATLEKDCP